MTTTDWVMVPREPTEEMVAAGRRYAVPATQAIIPIYTAMLSASPPPVSLEEIVEVLKVVDNDVRHHLRSDEIAPALLRPHAVQAVRSLLSRLKGMGK